VGTVKEFIPLKKMIKEIAKETGAEGKVHYAIGTMIEVPRAALTADELAVEADFFSFGTNDLTQMTCGFSGDDSASFLKEYVSQKIYSKDPFQSIDQTGVGKLMQVCVNLARGAKLDIDIGICGEHGGDPQSVEFCHLIGLDNVSCSPFRVPIARLAAAQRCGARLVLLSCQRKRRKRSRRLDKLRAQLQANAEGKAAKLVVAEEKNSDERKDDAAASAARKVVKPATLRVSDTVSYTPPVQAASGKKQVKPKKEKLQGVCEFTCYTVPAGNQNAVVDFFLKAGWKEQE